MDGIRYESPAKFMRYGNIITGIIDKEYKNIYFFVFSIPSDTGSIGILAFL